MNEPFGPADVGPLDQVQPKMKVVDADGVELGSVEDISMSDAGAITTAGEDYGRSRGILGGRGWIGGREPRVPEPMRTRLLRIGYIKLSGHDLPHHQRYVRGDCIARVENGRVELSVRKEELAAED